MQPVTCAGWMQELLEVFEAGGQKILKSQAYIYLSCFAFACRFEVLFGLLVPLFSSAFKVLVDRISKPASLLEDNVKSSNTRGHFFFVFSSSRNTDAYA